MTSAGLLLFRRTHGAVEVLLAHPGGPFWSRRDDGAWTLPEGEVQPGEDPQAAALREFTEETGHAPTGPLVALGEIRQKGGKRVLGWACEGDFEPGTLRSNAFEMEWPPRSGRMQAFPEVDRVGWFTPEAARAKLLPAQLPFIERLQESLRS